MTSFTETEEVVLGFCLKRPEALSQVAAAGVAPESFSVPEYRDVFLAMLSSEREGLKTNVANMVARHPGLTEALLRVHEAAPISLDLKPFLTDLLAATWQRRATDVLENVRERIGRRQRFEDIAPLRAAAVSAIDQLTTAAEDRGPKTIGQVIDAFDPELERRIAERRAGKPPGITTGIAALDAITGGGLGAGWITTVAARTGKGKTTLAINLMHAAAKAGYACAYFTVEMLSHEILVKLLSHAAQVNGTKLRIGELEESELDKLHLAERELYRWPIWFDDTTRANFEAVEYACLKLKRQGRLDLIVLDYIQQFHLPGKWGSTNERITAVSHRLKQLANELKISVISVAQLNREAEKGELKPDVFHIKDAGAIEQDSDVILLLHYDGPGDVKLFVGKNRHGKERTAFPIGADLARSTFRNLNLNLEAFK